MTKGLENLASMEYPGRVIILGKDKTGENVFVVYAITGRSPSSQARKLVAEGKGVWTKPTDEEMLKKGDIDLLIYPAIYIHQGIAVSNGKQTDDIKKHLIESKTSSEVLRTSLKQWDYEPDAPNYTPRISGCILSLENASLSIIKRAQGGTSINGIYDFRLEQGRGKLIATYQGKNKDPLPSYTGEPMDVKIEGLNPEEAAQEVYQAMAPQIQKKDFRVAAACVFSKNPKEDIFDIHIINKQE